MSRDNQRWGELTWRCVAAGRPRVDGKINGRMLGSGGGQKANG